MVSLCERGWHQGDTESGSIFFRSVAPTVYRIGPAPDDRVCRTIWCLDANRVPWTCLACGRPIDSPHSPLSRLAKRRHDHGEDHARRAGPSRTSRRLRLPFQVRLSGSSRGPRAPPLSRSSNAASIPTVCCRSPSVCVGPRWPGRPTSLAWPLPAPGEASARPQLARSSSEMARGHCRRSSVQP